MNVTASHRFHPSTRVRLTAWYAALLVLVLFALGASVDTLARNRLMADVDHRLQSTAEDIGSGIERNLASWPFSTEPVSVRRHRPDSGLLRVARSADPDHLARPGRLSAAPSTPRANRSCPSPESPAENRESSRPSWRAMRLAPSIIPVTVTDRNGVRWYIGAVIVGERLTTMHETLASLRQVLLVTSALGLALALAGGWVLAGRALRPVDRVTAAAAAIATGDGTATSLSSRLLVPPTNDELSRLSATFNAMLDRLQASFRAQERFVGDASHELRTPLTAIRGNVDVLHAPGASRRSRRSTRPISRPRSTTSAAKATACGACSTISCLLARADADVRKRPGGHGPDSPRAGAARRDRGGSRALRRGAGVRPDPRAGSAARRRGARRPRPPPPAGDDPARQRDPAYPARWADPGRGRGHSRMARRASPSATKGKGSPRSTCRTSSSGSTGPMERVAEPQAAPDWAWPSPRPSAGPTAATFR